MGNTLAKHSTLRHGFSFQPAAERRGGSEGMDRTEAELNG